jgi:hypothetical protein
LNAHGVFFLNVVVGMSGQTSTGAGGIARGAISVPIHHAPLSFIVQLIELKKQLRLTMATEVSPHL